MLAIARALMLDPALLLLDEPSAGLSPAMLSLVFDRIANINATGVALLLVEHNAREALRMSTRGYVLAGGENRLEDTGPELLNNPEISPPIPRRPLTAPAQTVIPAKAGNHRGNPPAGNGQPGNQANPSYPRNP